MSLWTKWTQGLVPPEPIPDLPLWFHKEMKLVDTYFELFWLTHDPVTDSYWRIVVYAVLEEPLVPSRMSTQIFERTTGCWVTIEQQRLLGTTDLARIFAMVDKLLDRFESFMAEVML